MSTLSTQETQNASITLFSDKPALMRMIKDNLRDCGYGNVTVISDATRVAESMASSRSSLLVVDLDAERDASHWVMETVRKHEQLFQVPILAMTGNASKDVVLKAARAGANDVMVKPFPMKQFQERVRMALIRK